MRKMLIGVVICLLLAVVYVGTSIYKSVYATVKVEEEKIIDGNKIDSLNIKTSSANVRITSDKTDQIKVKLDGKIKKDLKKDYKLKVEELNGQLEVQYLSNENLIGIKLGSEKDINVSIVLPEKVYRKLNVSTSSGLIEVENIVVDNMELATTSGSQTLVGTETKGDAVFQSTSGDIKLDSNIITSFIVKTKSGKVGTQLLDSQSGQIESSSGDVTLKMGSMIKELDINTTSGDVIVDFEKNPNSLSVIFKGDSGELDVSLPDIMYKDKDKNSAIGVIGDGENLLNVKTTSGDLMVK
ncbi:DUF4097 family beta strand repeat-containing protein [Lysinibacillus sp. RS5]|uniref:DUF4097 family beta strand repeat-containing protein n=1 Tax=unclassified Lysinibacillus TaxID=2636778 RepID=UPI0035BE61CE